MIEKIQSVTWCSKPLVLEVCPLPPPATSSVGTCWRQNFSVPTGHQPSESETQRVHGVRKAKHSVFQKPSRVLVPAVDRWRTVPGTGRFPTTDPSKSWEAVGKGSYKLQRHGAGSPALPDRTGKPNAVTNHCPTLQYLHSPPLLPSPTGNSCGSVRPPSV